VDVVAFSSQTPPVVSIVARPDSPSAWIRLIGDLDMAAEPALASAVKRLNGRPIHFIVVDLTAVTFACSTFANFVAALHRDHPEADLVLHHPSRLVRVILAVTGLDGYVTMNSPPVDSSVRRQPGYWRAMNRQSGRTNNFGDSAATTPDRPW
jgi:anti-anti-sigma factor